MAKYLDFSGLRRFKNKLGEIFQSKLISGTNIKTINNESILGSGDIQISSPTKTSDLINDSGFINKDVNDLTHYTLAVDAGSFIDLDINSTTYVVTLSLKNSSGTVISSDSIDLPLESVVVNGEYDNTNKKIVLTLQSGSTIDIPVGDLISGLQTEITSSNKLASDLVDDTNQVNKFVSSTEKNTWNAKQDALVSGVNIKTVNNESILGTGDISILYDAPIYYIDTNSSSNPFYFCGKKKGLYFFNRSISSVYYTFDETTHVISEPLGLAHYIAILNDIPEDVADDTVLAYYVKYSTVNDRYTDYPVTVARQNPGLYNTGLNITSYSARTYVSKDTAQTISGKKTFSTLPESSVVPTTNKQLVNKKYVDDSLVSKQDILVSGSNVKTINNESILGSGDISITGKLPSITTATNIWELEEGIYDVGPSVNLYYKSSGYVTTSSYGAFLFVGHESSNRRPFYLMGRDPLTSSRNNDYIYVGVAQNNVYGIIYSYNLDAISSAVTLYDNQTISSKKTFSTLPESSVVPTTNNQLVNKKYVDDSLVSKQDLLVSGSNIKTINNESILGSGDISITGELPSITTATNIWELEEGIYDVESGVNLYYKSGGYVTTSSYGAFLFVGHESSNSRPFYLMGRDPLTSSRNRNYIYIGVAQNNVYGVIDDYNLGAISSAVTLYDKQTIYGVKNFYVLPESSIVPTTDNQLVNKKYVDDNAGGTDEVFYISTTHDSEYTPFDLSGLSKGLYVFNPLSSNVGTYISYGSSNSGKFVTMNTPRILIVPEDIEPYESNTYSSGDVLAYYYCLGVGNTESVISYVTRLTYSTTYVYHLAQNSTTYFENRFVNLTGAQSIGGVKTFGDYPVIGRFSGLPTTDNQFTPKKYVDDLMANIAPIYSSSSTYDVGDYVVYLGLLYKCNTTISTAESWDSTHWDRTTVVDILSNS